MNKQNQMIELKSNNIRFKYRVVGIAIHNDCVLLQTVKGFDFWALPGGRAEFFEDSMATLKREMKEELGVDIIVDRLIWIVENFYESNHTLIHELALYYQMSFPKDTSYYELDGPFRASDNGYEIIFQWHNIDKLSQIKLYPEFLQKSLRSMPMGTEHIIISDFQGIN